MYLNPTLHVTEANYYVKEILPSFDRDIVVDTAEGVAELIGTFRSRSMLAQYFRVLWQIVTWYVNETLLIIDRSNPGTG